MRISDWSSDVCSSDLFAAAARISDINLGLYRSFVQPWVRAAVTPQSAEWMQRMHPLRLPYELISDRNPWVAPVAQVADQARQHRQPVAPDNPYAVLERMASDSIEAGLDRKSPRLNSSH